MVGPVAPRSRYPRRARRRAAAEATGVSALRHKLLALALSTALAGLARGAFAYYHVSYYPRQSRSRTRRRRCPPSRAPPSPRCPRRSPADSSRRARPSRRRAPRRAAPACRRPSSQRLFASASRYSRERLPLPRDAFVQRGAGDVLDALHQADQPVVLVGPHRREADAAVAHHDRRHAVLARRREQRVPGDLAVVVRVDVDEAGRDEEPVGVDACAPQSRRRGRPRRCGPPSTATSAVRAGAPLPSTTLPPRIKRSNVITASQRARQS